MKSIKDNKGPPRAAILTRYLKELIRYHKENKAIKNKQNVDELKQVAIE